MLRWLTSLKRFAITGLAAFSIGLTGYKGESKIETLNRYFAYASEGRDSKTIFQEAGIEIVEDYENLELSLVMATEEQLSKLKEQGLVELYLLNPEETPRYFLNRRVGEKYVGIISDGSELPNHKNALEHIASELQSLGVDGSRVTIAIFDTGCYPRHELFQDNPLVGFYDAVYGREEAYDDESHGTWVAGIVDQLLPKARFYIIKALDEYGYNRISCVVKGLEKVLELKPDIVNCSWGLTEISEWENMSQESAERLLEEALERVAKSGIMVVSSAGNENTFPSENGRPETLPPRSEYVISVGAIDRNHELSWWFNSGTSLGSDLYALGTSVKGAAIPNGYYYGDGTSASSPIISAVFAAILEYSRINNLGLSLEEAKRLILETAEPQTSILRLRGDNRRTYEFKVLDVDEIVEYLKMVREGRY